MTWTRISLQANKNHLVHWHMQIKKFQRLEKLQPMLAWKLLEIIKQTLEVTTQWTKPVNHYPMKKNHTSRFLWYNRSILQEEVATDA